MIRSGYLSANGLCERRFPSHAWFRWCSRATTLPISAAVRMRAMKADIDEHKNSHRSKFSWLIDHYDSAARATPACVR